MRELSEDYGAPRDYDASEPDRVPSRLGCMIGAALCGLSAMIVSAGFICLFMTWTAKAHEALPTAAMPQGWSYPWSCCSGQDCRQIDARRVKETRSGYQMPTGEIIPYAGDKRLKDSPDGQYHWCTVAGAEDSRTICLFSPPKSY